MRRTSPGRWPRDVLAQRMQDDLRFQKFNPGVESEKGVVACSAYGIAAEVPNRSHWVRHCRSSSAFQPRSHSGMPPSMSS